MTVHKSVLSEEALSLLSIQPSDTFVDCTLGGGGHSEAVCRRFPKVTVVGMDLDADAVNRSRERLLFCSGAFHLVEANSKDIGKVLKDLGLDGVDRILLDLGLSSDQLEQSGRGFSFNRDEPLLMTFAKQPSTGQLTALEIVNVWPEDRIAETLYDLGEERHARQIAKAICAARVTNFIRTSGQLAAIVKDAVPGSYRYGRIHPATKTFQALRMSANRELENLSIMLSEGFRALKLRGRLAVISFHSLEDRVVKDTFRRWSSNGFGLLITKKPVVPTDSEISINPRARSAKLRVIEKVSSL